MVGAAYLGKQLLHRQRRVLLPELQRAAVDYGKRARRGDAEEPPEDAAATDVPLCPLALAAAQMPVGHVDDAEEGEESDTALGHLEEEAPEAEEEAPEAAELAPDGGPWMPRKSRVSKIRALEAPVCLVSHGWGSGGVGSPSKKAPRLVSRSPPYMLFLY